MKTEYSFDNETWYDAPDGKAFIPGIGEINLRMTNETTASQPKSIGDDAQFQKLLLAWHFAKRKEMPNQRASSRKALESYIDSKLRAPAAQASATIQAGQWVRCTPDLINAGVSCGETPRRPNGVTHSHDHFIAHSATIQELAVVAEPVAWRIGMIVHHDKAKAELDSIHWNVPLEPLYLAAPIVSQPVESKPLYLVKFDGTEAWKEASEDAYWTFSERNRKIVYELAAPIVAEPVSHELMQQLGTMRAVGAAPMVADPAGVALEAAQYALKRASSLFACGFNVAHARSCTNGVDETGASAEDYAAAADDICSAISKAKELVRATLAATVKAVPSEALELAGMVVKATFGEHKILVPRVDLSGKEIGTLVYFADPLADKTGGGE